MKNPLQRKRRKNIQKLTQISTPQNILIATVVALSATVGALLTKLRARANPEAHTLKTIAQLAGKAEDAIENLDESTRLGSPAIQSVAPHLAAIRAEVEKRQIANGTGVPVAS